MPTAGEARELAFALLVPPLAIAALPMEGPAAIPGILTIWVLDQSVMCIWGRKYRYIGRVWVKVEGCQQPNE
jgi:hypothetical protein